MSDYGGTETKGVFESRLWLLTCFDKEGKDLHDRLAKPIFSHQDEGVGPGTQRRRVEFKQSVAGDGGESGYLAERGDCSAAVVGGSEDAPLVRAY